MQRRKFRDIFLLSIVSFLLSACGEQAGTNVNLANSRTNAANSISNLANTTSVNSNGASAAVTESREPAQYQAAVTVKLETLGGQQNVALPNLTANVARSGTDRRMEFALPAGGRVVFLDKGDTHYLVLPEKKQYAELNRESLGFDVRRMLMPEQIVEQVKKVAGMERVGEETYNGRDVVKYRYAAVANTQTRAGQVDTESFLIVDKLTGLPLRSETVSQSQGDAQGYKGLRIITEIGEIRTETPSDLFAAPTDLQKIDSAQVRAQVDLIFNSVAMLIGQMMKQGQPAANSMTSPAR
jgi:hypothetical protein